MPCSVVEYLKDSYEYAKQCYKNSGKNHGERLGIVDRVHFLAIAQVVMDHFHELILHDRARFPKADDDRTFQEIYEGDAYKYSEKKRRMTQGQFLAELSEVMKQTGLNLENLKALCCIESKSSNKPTGHEIDYYFFPVFLKMLRRGYWIRDLIAP